MAPHKADKESGDGARYAPLLLGVTLLAVVAVVWIATWLDPNADDFYKELLHTGGLVVTFFLGHWIGHAKHADKDHMRSYRCLLVVAGVLALAIVVIYYLSKDNQNTPVSSASTEALHQIGSLVALVTGHHVGTRNKSAGLKTASTS
jgi:hypothetical protein